MKGDHGDHCTLLEKRLWMKRGYGRGGLRSDYEKKNGAAGIGYRSFNCLMERYVVGVAA
jgi:hypothetical protein